MSTIKDIAVQTGLSVPTVKNVLSARAHLYSVKTQQRVLAVARELDYRPNGAAKAVSTGRFGCAALLMSAFGTFSTLPNELMFGIDDALIANGLHLTIARLHDQELSDEERVPKVLREWMADGLLINYTDHIPPRLRQMIARHSLPAIWLNSKQPHDCVRPDDHGGGRMAAEHVLRRGARRVAYLDLSHGQSLLDETHYSATDREAGIRAVLAEQGLRLSVIRDAVAVARDRRAERIAAVLAGPDRPDALTAYGSGDACPAYLAARLAGLKVPSDLQLVVFGDAPIDSCGHSLPTFLVPQYQMGQQAVRMLLSKIQNPARIQPAETVPFKSSLDQ